ncbi:MAG: hypothetical protein KC910_03260 [Candidatus Eremiobacteraeota bacterium]|nr:hypothetical protein [Candidatus Eremiobacteraeota bacterium]
MELEQFLQSNLEAGWHESTGVFTTNLEALHHKMGEQYNADPTFYLKKLVQVGVSSGARGIHLWPGSFSTAVTLKEPDGLFPLGLDSLLDGLLNPTALEPGPLRHLVMAIFSARAKNIKWLECRWSDGQTAQALTVTPDECKSYEIKQSSRHFLYFRRGHRLASFWQNLNNTRIDESPDLANRCQFSPVPVQLRNWVVKPGRWGGFNLHGEEECLAAFTSVESWSLHAGFPPFPRARTVVGEGPAAKSLRWQVSFCGQQQRPGPSSNILVFTHDKPATVRFVLDGVLSDARPWPGASPGFEAVVEGAGLTTDLSEFAMLDEPRLAERLRLLDDDLAAFARQLEPHLDSLTPALKTRLGVWLGAVVVGLTSATLSPFLIVPSGLLAGYGFHRLARSMLADRMRQELIGSRPESG